MKIRITWEVSDGYVGKSRPQHSVFNTNDWTNDEDEWNEMSEEEQNKLIDEFIQEEFDQHISWGISNKTIISE